MVEVRGSKSENFYIREKKKNDGTLWKKKILASVPSSLDLVHFTRPLSIPIRLSWTVKMKKQCHVRTGLGFDHPIKFRSH